MAVSIGLVACAHQQPKLDPISVPLAYKANLRNEGISGGLSCSAIAQIQGADDRVDKMLGVRTIEETELKADVTASGDPAVLVQSAVQDFLTVNGIRVGAGGPKLVVALNSVRTTENAWHRSTYSARVSLHGTLEAPSGKVCWQETAQGSANDYGYSGSIENYQETLNNAMDAASLNLAQSQAFKDALCHCGT